MMFVYMMFVYMMFVYMMFVCAAFLILSTWSWAVLCAPDVFSWNFSFMVINCIQVGNPAGACGIMYCEPHENWLSRRYSFRQVLKQLFFQSLFFLDELNRNKKVLLRERKRHTDRLTILSE